MLCHSVSSWGCPSCPVQRRLVASENVVTGSPPWVYRISGSRPTFPINMTLFNEPAMANLSLQKIHLN
jgi:hypothetical protein